MSTEGRGTPAFDPASVPRSVWISAGGAAVLLFSVFFSWYSLGGFGFSGWSTVDAAKLVFLLALIALAAWVIELFVPTVALPVPASLIALGCGGLAVLLVLLKMVSKPDGVGLSWGIFLALLAAVAVVAGAYMRMNES